MRILYITPAYYPAVFWGGPIVSVRLVVNELKSSGLEVDVWTNALGLESNRETERLVDNVNIRYFKYFTLAKWQFPFKVLSALWKSHAEYDVFHLSSVWDPIAWLSAMVLILRKRKYVISPRGSLDNSLMSKSFIIKKIMYFLIIRKVITKSEGIHYTTVFERQRFINFFGSDKPGIVAYNPIIPSNYTREVDQDLLKKFAINPRKYVLYLGRLNWKKGIIELLEAWSRADRLDYKLVLAGPDENGYGRQVLAKIKSLGLEFSVVLTGLVDGDLKLALLQNAYLFVLTSMSENFAVAVAESMACGVPVLISNNVGIKELVLKYQCGKVVKLDTDEITNTLNSILRDDNLRNSLASNCKKAVEQELLPTSVARQIRNLYESIHPACRQPYYTE